MLGILSMMTISVITDPAVALLTIIFKRFKINPDNIVGPIQSSLVDVVAIVIIAMYARLLS